METWKNVVGWEGIYEVSDLGNVKRIKAPSLAHLSHIGKIVRSTNVNGYRHLSLKDRARKKTALVHSLVMEAFVGPRQPGIDVNHKNGDKSDNRLENLEYVTKSENQRHMYHVLKALDQRGQKNNAGSKLTDEMVRTIRTCDTKTTKLARQLGVSHTLISNVRNGKVWRHITC